ncbi:unnamed protein product [Rotaria sp. Silwood2]|nr:unnamed protein product [Rotaria sp. Silwood2]CAF3426150.1 unnamed protein product [Rotaria sp. Silwood2]
MSAVLQQVQLVVEILQQRLPPPPPVSSSSPPLCPRSHPPVAGVRPYRYRGRMQMRRARHTPQPLHTLRRHLQLQ